MSGYYLRCSSHWEYESHGAILKSRYLNNAVDSVVKQCYPFPYSEQLEKDSTSLNYFGIDHNVWSRTEEQGC